MSTKSQLLERNIATIYPSKDSLVKKLDSGKKLKIYLGIDPTSPEIHIGNAIALWKLKEFQDEGHIVTLLVGDFTGMIGDPTDKTAIRKRMNREDLVKNSQKYKSQASKILNFEGKNPAKLELNSRWLSKLSLEEILELLGYFTVQQLIERDMFQKRIGENKPIGLNEFIYPLLHGYDSVALDTDIEIGGTDQTFNMLAGRTLMKSMKNKEKFIITFPLLEGTDGRKMSKSYGNTIGITNKPNDMFGKVMSISDDFIIKYFQLTTKKSLGEISIIKKSIEEKSKNPMEIKKDLAFEVVKIYHGESEAKKASTEFEKVFQKGERTKEIETVSMEKSILPKSFAYIANASGATPSVSAAINLAKNRGLKFDGNLVENPLDKFSISSESGTIIDVGKRRSYKITWE